MEDLTKAATSMSPHRALVIDDEFTIRLALRRFFTRMGWSVDEASIEQAIRFLNEGRLLADRPGRAPERRAAL